MASTGSALEPGAHYDGLALQQFHNEEDEFVVSLPPETLGDIDPEERLTAYLRYDSTCIIQEWIVRNIMDN